MMMELVSLALASTGGGTLPWNATAEVVIGSMQVLGGSLLTGSAIWAGVQAMGHNGMEQLREKMLALGVGAGIILGARPMVGIFSGAAGGSPLVASVGPVTGELVGDLVGMGLYAMLILTPGASLWRQLRSRVWPTR